MRWKLFIITLFSNSVSILIYAKEKNEGILFQSYLSIGYHNEKNEGTPLFLEPFSIKEHLSCHLAQFYNDEYKNTC